jgi:uncharacterized protein
MEENNNSQEKKCHCQDENNSCGCKKIKIVILVLAMVIIGAIVIVSILRDRIVNQNQNQVTVFGQGKVSYQPDTAEITLGVQIDKAPNAQDALNQLNTKMAKIIDTVKAQGIMEEDIKTQNYSLNPQYDYNDGSTTPAGYNANEQLIIKVKDTINNPDLVGKVTSAANGAGANQVLGVNYTVADINALKQQARLEAIKDAKSKAPAMFQAAGMRVGKVVGWYENILQSPDMQGGYQAMGMGGAEGSGLAKAAPQPQIPSGTQEIIIETGVNYQVK